MHFFGNGISKAPEFAVNLSFAKLNLSPKMSSQARSPIVGLYGMLCVWAACLSGSGAVLSPNGTIFEDNCKKTSTCEALKYNTCLGYKGADKKLIELADKFLEME